MFNFTYQIYLHCKLGTGTRWTEADKQSGFLIVDQIKRCGLEISEKTFPQLFNNYNLFKLYYNN